ncbi:MAG: LamG domain-containing protein [Candidatus Marinimicrobia bacterium]|nr:LamG domain-containing protein [Candidatus Neomarinimicrobiota bacterium]
MWRLFILLFSLSCTELLLQNTTQYHSIQLNGNAWIHIINRTNDENDVSVMDNAFTLEFWFTGGNSGNSESACLASIIDENGAIKFGLFKDPLSPNALEVWLDDTRLDPISLNLDEDLNSGSTFHHIAITSNENIQIYLDGKKIETLSSMSINIDENDLVIGGKVNRALSTLGNFWTGNIDEMRLWSSVLTASTIDFHVKNPDKLVEISEDEEGNKWWETTPLTGLWRFQFDTGDTSPIIPDESCEVLSRMYSFTSSCNAYDATIYTLGSSVATFSEKHP